MNLIHDPLHPPQRRTKAALDYDAEFALMVLEMDKRESTAQREDYMATLPEDVQIEVTKRLIERGV